MSCCGSVYECIVLYLPTLSIPIHVCTPLNPSVSLTDNDNEDTMSICSFGSRADLHRLGEAPVPSWVVVGEPVVVLQSQGGSKTGTVQFVGQTEFAGGNWIGVELDSPDGGFTALID